MKSFTYLDKDDRGADGHETIQLAENIVFLLRIGAVHVHLGDALDRKVLLAELHLVRARCKLLRVLQHVGRECRREQQGLNPFGKRAGG